MRTDPTRPLPVGAGLAVVAGYFAVMAVANGPLQQFALLAELVGLAGLFVGLRLRADGPRTLGERSPAVPDAVRERLADDGRRPALDELVEAIERHGAHLRRRAAELDRRMTAVDRPDADRGEESDALDRRRLGTALAAGGGAVAVLAVAWAAQSIPGLVPTAELLPGMVGLVVLTLALAPVRPGRERALVAVGSGLVLCSVLAGGLFYDARPWMLLAGTGLSVVAWDAGERAVNMGEHVGGAAGTWPVEALHAGASLAVGGVGLLVALAVLAAGVTGLPFAGLTALVAAGLALTIALAR